MHKSIPKKKSNTPPKSQKKKKPLQVPLQPQVSLIEAFHELDTNGDGLLTTKEMVKLISETSVGNSEDAKRKTNKTDAKLNYKEFEKMFKD